jgi:uncharacterized membrane protein (DUF106 family)
MSSPAAAMLIVIIGLAIMIYGDIIQRIRQKRPNQITQLAENVISNKERRMLLVITIIVIVAFIATLSFYAGIQHEKQRRYKEYQEYLERQGRTPYYLLDKNGQPTRAPLYFFK